MSFDHLIPKHVRPDPERALRQAIEEQYLREAWEHTAQVDRDFITRINRTWDDRAR